jgi:hypothetical protein
MVRPRALLHAALIETQVGQAAVRMKMSPFPLFDPTQGQSLGTDRAIIKEECHVAGLGPVGQAHLQGTA